MPDWGQKDKLITCSYVKAPSLGTQQFSFLWPFSLNDPWWASHSTSKRCNDPFADKPVMRSVFCVTRVTRMITVHLGSCLLLVLQTPQVTSKGCFCSSCLKSASSSLCSLQRRVKWIFIAEGSVTRTDVSSQGEGSAQSLGICAVIQKVRLPTVCPCSLMFLSTLSTVNCVMHNEFLKQWSKTLKMTVS